MADIITASIGQFSLDQLLVRSSWGEIWCATWQQTGSRIAIKRVNRTNMNAAPPAYRHHWPAALQREIELFQRLSASHLVKFICAAKERDGLPVIVLELLDVTLRQHMQQVSVLRVDQALEWCWQLLEGLAALHEAGLRHMDLKPANLLLSPLSPLGRSLNLADLGSCLPTQQHEHRITGSRGWQAPEVFCPAGQHSAGGYVYRSDHRADFYALGLLLFCMLTGQKTRYADACCRVVAGNEAGAQALSRSMPNGLADQDLLMLHAAFSQAQSAVPAGLDALLEQLLAPQPSQRPASCREIQKRLELLMLEGHRLRPGAI